MVQNRNKLIKLFIGNVSNAILHKILEKAIDDDNIRSHYAIELKRASKGYENINFAMVETLVESALKNMNIT